jgi:hypothetical protein
LPNIYDKSTQGMAVGDLARLAYRRNIVSTALSMLCAWTGGQVAELLRHTEVGCWLGGRLRFMVDPRNPASDVAFSMAFMTSLSLVVYGGLWWWAPKSLVARMAQGIERSRSKGRRDGVLSWRFTAFLCAGSLLFGVTMFWLAASYAKLPPSWKSCPSMNGAPAAPSPSGGRGPPPCPEKEKPSPSSLPCA